VAVDDFLDLAFERNDSVGSKRNPARRSDPTPLKIVRACLNPSHASETIRDLGMARSKDADAESRLRGRQRYAVGAIEGERKKGGSTDRNETEVAVTPTIRRRVRRSRC
jgi:hypothetical protein